MIAPEEIKRLIANLLPELRAIRHHLHAHPELALQETETAAYIKQQLGRLDVTVLPPVLGTDIVAKLEGDGPGPHIVLRADMDALPIQEPGGKAYTSTNPGMMHACGHDGHMTMLLGAAMILSQLKDAVSGSVRFVFQPGEEIVAAGRDLVESGVLDDPAPDLVLAFHNMPGIPTGVFSTRPGPFMAAADFFKLTIKGKGGHGSRPEDCVDPIYIATRVLNELYQIPSRQFSALDSLVISPCMIAGGQNANVIPDEVYIEGTIRYLTKEVGARIPKVFEDVIRGECQIAGGDYELEYSRPYMPTINDPDAADYGRRIATQAFGEERWEHLERPFMGSEDFSFFLDRYPGAMFLIGNGQKCPSLHNQGFDFNDEIIADGVLFFTLSVLNYPANSVNP